MTTPPAHDHARPTMQCMEVWGGNQASDNGVIMPGLDAWVFSRPFEGDDAGGDIHFVSSCATGRITRVLVADVSGHGRRVAQIASSLRRLMRLYVNIIDQTGLVQSLNAEFAALTGDGVFATAIAGTYWAPTGRFVICNAGHPRPLWYRAKLRQWAFAEDVRGRAADGLSNIPLGIAEPARYDEQAIRLAPGDLLLIYTDSLPESRGPGGGTIGEQGLLEIISGLDVARPDLLIPSLLAALEERAGGPPGDDVTVLLLRPNALRPRVSLFGGIRAGFLLAREFIRSLLPGGEPFPRPQLERVSILGAFIPRLNRSSSLKPPPD